MERYYFTFMLNDVEHHNCFHVEEAETYEEARDKMVERFGTDWGFQYSENEWKVSKQWYEDVDTMIRNLPPYYDGMTQAELFNLTEI
jgi:lysine-tRNA ligase|nr:MAG TPA: hypothetical protein [Caudoviricetes sp.]